MECNTLTAPAYSPGLEVEEVVWLSKRLKAWTRYATSTGGVRVPEVCGSLRLRGGRRVTAEELAQVLDAEYNRRDHGRGRLVLIRADGTRADSVALRHEKAATLWIANAWDDPPQPAAGVDASARLVVRASKRLKGWTRREHQHRGLRVREALKECVRGEGQRRVAITRSLLRAVLELEMRTPDKGRGRLLAVDAAGRHLDPAQLESCGVDAAWIVNVASQAAAQSPGAAVETAMPTSPAVDAPSITGPSVCAFPLPPCAESQEGGVDAFEATAVFVQHGEEGRPATRSAARCVMS